MRRKTFLATSVCLAVIFAAVYLFGSYATAYAGPKTFEWNLSIWGSSRGMTKAAEWWANEMEKRSNGRFKVKWGWGNVLAKQTENLTGIRSGLFELGAFCTGFDPGQLPLHTVISLPFMHVGNNLYQARIEYAMAQQPALVKEEEKRWNAKYLLPFSLPPYEFMGGKRVDKVADLKGVRLRGLPSIAKVFEKFGAVSVIVPTSESYMALERGIIDIIAMPWSYGFGSYKIHEVSKFATLNLGLTSHLCALYVNKTAWDSLPEDIKAIHVELMKDYNQVLADGYEKADKKWIPIYKKAGIEIITLPASEKAKLVEGASGLYEEWIKDKEAKGFPGRDVFEQLQSLRKKVLAGEIPNG